MNEKSFEKYFQGELAKLQELAKEFSATHPAIAPLLDTHNADPDAARLLEGVAFLTALLHQKLDDNFPEIIHSLTNILFPHYLKPIPALSIVEFRPKPSLREMLKVKKGVLIKSKPLDGVECSFTTTSDFKLYPLEITNIVHKSREGKRSSLIIDIESQSSDISLLHLNELDFYLSRNYNEAVNLFMLLDSYLESISLVIGDSKISLALESFQAKGFERGNSLFSYPKNSFWSYMLLQEYFILPQKFLFFRVENLKKMNSYGSFSKFQIIFNFKKSPLSVTSLSHDAIKLFCTPVNNLFQEEAEPITLTHQKELLHIRPSFKYRDNYQVYDIQKVSGYIQGEDNERTYAPFESFEKSETEKNIYQVHRKVSIVNAKEELYISLHYKDKLPTKKEILSIKMSCTNGTLPERLQLGEISQRSNNSPELATFKNIVPCTLQIDTPLDKNSLWQFISHLSVNLLTLADIKTFKEMLKLYMFPHNRDKSKVMENQKKIDAIEAFEIEPIDRVQRGYLLRGHKIFILIREDYFASLGDVYLFCSVLFQFLGNYTSLNTFIEMEVKEKITGEILRWKPMLGNKALI